MNNTKNCTAPKRNNAGFPGFANVINEILNAPVHVKDNSARKTPAVNVREDDKSYMIDMSVPGYNKKDIIIEVKDNKLYISSEKENTIDDTYKITEFSFGAFKRSFNLPKDANQEDINAKVTNGILTVQIGKKPEIAPKQITIK